MAMSWIHQGGILFLFLVVGTVSGMDPGTSSISVQTSTIGSQLSTLEAQLIQLEERVEGLQQENMEYKEQIVHLEQVTEELERRASLLESLCGSDEMETEISEMETGIHGAPTTTTTATTTTTTTSPTTTTTQIVNRGSIVAIGGHNRGDRSLRSAEVVNASCDFPLPEGRTGHMSVTTADGKTLVCGGMTPSGYMPYECLQFNFQSKSWEHHSYMWRRYDGSRSTMVNLRHGVYVVGHRDANTFSEFLATGSSEWTMGPEAYGRGVYGSCVAKLSDTEFVLLEGIYDETQARVYNIETAEWREWPRLTVPIRRKSSCVGLGDIVLIAGGEDPTYNTGVRVVHGRTVIFDTKTGSAREVASLKYPRSGAAMILHGGKPLILGGYDDRVMRSDGEIWNMDTETWEEADIHLNVGRTEFSLVTMAEEIECE